VVERCGVRWGTRGWIYTQREGGCDGIQRGLWLAWWCT
jgi:hypothetical protein